MALDGICIAAIAKELNERLANGRLVKVTQPERDEILLSVKREAANEKLFINVSAGMPFCYLTDENKPSPMTAPNFCMVLRKHLQGGRIIGVSQPGLERVLNFEIEHLDEMGDLCKRVLVLELMGKHSNLILTDGNHTVIDSLKHVSALVSSVREVLPGREYFIPKTEEKADPMLLDEEELRDAFFEAMKKPMPAFKKIYTSFTGISPFVAMDICNAAGVDGDRELTKADNTEALYKIFKDLLNRVKEGDFAPCILYENDRIKDFAVALMSQQIEYEADEFESVSTMLSTFYSDKNKADVMRAKSADLKKHVKTILERDIKKLDLQLKQQKDAEDREKYRIFGELLNAYAYQLKDGEKSVEVLNYYDNTNIKIPLDENKTISENAVRYFDKYNKLKRTAAALTEQINETNEEITYLDSVLLYIGLAEKEEDLTQIRRELAEKGFVKYRTVGKKNAKLPKAKPVHYRTVDGYDIYVGKNNYQNEAVTFEIATGNDWWFHAKGVPGAHVVVKCSFANQATEWEMPDEIFELAGALAAANSRNKDMEKVEVDYLRKKNIKRPNNAATGYVIYYTNYSLVAKTDLSQYSLKEI